MSLSGFAVAYGTVAGTVKGFSLAKQCEIDVTDIPDGVAGFDVPIIFEGASPVGVAWSVKVDGRPTSKFKAVVRDGRLRLVRRGLIVTVM